MDQNEIMRRDNDPILREYHAMMKGIDRGDPFHPQEVQNMINALVEEGYHAIAERLASARVNWDRG